MKNTYIIRRGYYNIFIKTSIYAFLLYYDHFSQGLFLPKHLSHPLIKRGIHYLLRMCIIITFVTGIYKLIYKTAVLNENALLIIKNMGTDGNTIKVVASNDTIKIIKEISNRKTYLKEKRFYNLYKNNPSKIKLPAHKFLNNNTIEIEFILSKNIQRLVTDGTISLKDVLLHYVKLKKELKCLYKSSPALIHGDLFLSNIFFQDNHYYFIDYSDSLLETLSYDLYTLLLSIAQSFHYATNTTQTIFSQKISNKPTPHHLGVSQKEFLRIEKKYHTHRAKKIPNIYNS